MPDVIQNTSIERLCAKCGYDLRGLVSNRCPECGEAFNPKQLSGANIPWLRRSAIGAWRAYWETVGMVMFHPVKFGSEIWDSPRLDPRGAVRFRRVIITQSLATTGLITASAWWGDRTGLTSPGISLAAMEVGAIAGVWIFLLVATDLVQDDPWQRALNHYTCAPLAIFPVAGILIVLGNLAAFPLWPIVDGVVAVILCWCILAHALVMHVIKKSQISTMGNLLVMPIGWAILASVAMLCGVALGSLTNTVLSQWM